ncbi:MAG: hypothetical protein U9N61_04255 [Euryarchaeota archaeon]|nr:hypothetical protein [Euryarchaeota archaeon]
MRTKLIVFVIVIIICISVSGCTEILGRTTFAYDLVVSPVNGTAIIYVPIAIDEDGSISEVMGNLTIYSYPDSSSNASCEIIDNVPSSNVSCEIIDTIHGKALKTVTDERIKIKNMIHQRGRGSTEVNITLWNETFENSIGNIWIYVDDSSTAEDVSITLDVWYVQSFLASGYSGSIRTEWYSIVLNNGWNTYPVYKRS